VSEDPFHGSKRIHVDTLHVDPSKVAVGQYVIAWAGDTPVMHRITHRPRLEHNVWKIQTEGGVFIVQPGDTVELCG
jgi:hypothetical protein